MLPEAVLKKASDEMLDYEGSGQSVAEMSHRSKVYDKIITDCKALLIETLNIPDNYEVLFLQGGASTQFTAVPLNLFKNKKADYVISGMFSKKAYEEASRYGDCKVVASSKDKTFSYVPEVKSDELRADADYVHICQNNTIFGTKFIDLPNTGDVPLVADLSSCILSEPIDVSKYGLIYAGAQKNMAPAGLTIVIVRKDLMGNAQDITPTMLNYAVQSENDSMYNTPPTYTIYMCKLVLEWIRDEIGGIDKMYELNKKKAAILYDFLDRSKVFNGCADKEYRSLMNATFKTDSEELDAKFVKAAEQNGFINLKGHRSVGGMRASIYNAMPIEGVEKLVNFMKEFEEEN